MLFFAPPPPPAILRAILTGSELRLLGEGGTLVRAVPTRAQELRWSPDGRTIALRTADAKLTRLDVSNEKAKIVPIAEGVESFGWTPESRLLVGFAGRGVSLFDPVSEKTDPLLPKAQHPVASPDGTRLAFLVRGEGSGVWISAAGGENPRRLVATPKDAEPTSVSWSYDARLLAWTDGKRLRLMRRDGGGERDLGPVDDPRAFWSPGSADLLARREGVWSVWSANRDRWTPLGVRGSEPPVWNGPRDLVAAEDGKLLTLRIGESPKPVEGVKDAKAVADLPSTYRGSAFPDPFARAPRPGGGEVAWQGRSLAFDPVEGRFEMTVESEISSTGTMLVLGRPQVRSAEVKDPALTRRLSLAPESELRITIHEGKIVGVYLPPSGGTAPVAPSVPVAGTRPLRPLRVAEYDGITQEKVVIPLLYPIPGKHKFVDTFLAARGGGSRRHHGNDLMAPKMTPLLAVFDGTVLFTRTANRGASNSLALLSDDGWTASYLHINNDTPKTDDGMGSMRYAFPADLQSGDRVRAGEVIAWCGDSGNAEDAGSHLHLELYDSDGHAKINPAPSLLAAERRETPLYIDPDPSLRAEKGELRWEGVVVGLQAEKRSVTVELTGIGEPGAAPVRNLSPRIVYLQLPAGHLLQYRDGDVKYPLDVARPGLRIGAVGKVDGAKMRTRRVTFSLGSR